MDRAVRLSRKSTSRTDEKYSRVGIHRSGWFNASLKRNYTKKCPIRSISRCRSVSPTKVFKMEPKPSSRCASKPSTRCVSPVLRCQTPNHFYCIEPNSCSSNSILKKEFSRAVSSSSKKEHPMAVDLSSKTERAVSPSSILKNEHSRPVIPRSICKNEHYKMKHFADVKDTYTDLLNRQGQQLQKVSEGKKIWKDNRSELLESCIAELNLFLFRVIPLVKSETEKTSTDASTSYHNKDVMIYDANIKLREFDELQNEILQFEELQNEMKRKCSDIKDIFESVNEQLHKPENNAVRSREVKSLYDKYCNKERQALMSSATNTRIGNNVQKKGIVSDMARLKEMVYDIDRLKDIACKIEKPKDYKQLKQRYHPWR